MSTQDRPINIAVFCSGGDAPGMNAAVRAVARMCISQGAVCWGVMRGYQGMVEDDMKILNWSDVGGIMHLGGTILCSARSTDFMTVPGRKRAAVNLIKKDIRGLVVIGGDGSLTGAHLFHREWPTFVQELLKEGRITEEEAARCPSLGIGGLVGSIDNDMCGTEITIGADSALNRIAHAIDCLTSTADSHQMTFVVEVMGRKCGWLALMATLISGADTVFIPEKPAPENWEPELVARLNKANQRKRHCIVIVAEGAVDVKGKHIAADYVRKILEESGRQTRCTILGHVQRGGSPTAMDRFISTVMGAEAVRVLLEPGGLAKSQLIGMYDDLIVISPLSERLEENQVISDSFKNIVFNSDRILELRGSTTIHGWHSYRMLQALPHEVNNSTSTEKKEQVQWPSMPPSQASKNLRIAVLTVGAAAPGMNAFVRCLVRMGLSKGHTILGIRNGLEGLLANEVEELEFTSVRGWSSLGGAAMGTSRTVPQKEQVELVRKVLVDQNKVDVFVILGGFEAYRTAAALPVSQLSIPVLVVPATISNNCPATDYSIGCDRGVNNLMESIDKIKQSAISSKRVYFIESIGGNCGYLTLLGGLCAGAEKVLLREKPQGTSVLLQDCESLKRRFEQKKRAQQCAVFVVNEKCDPLIDVAFLGKLFTLNSNDLYSVRTAQLGATQQGGDPTPFDRIRATLMAEALMSWLDHFIGQRTKLMRIAIGMISGKRAYTDITDLDAVSKRADRLPRYQNWLKYVPLFEITSGISPSEKYTDPQQSPDFHLPSGFDMK